MDTQNLAIGFITLGCPKNEVDTDKMRAAVSASAYSLSEAPEDADVLVVNTCSFIEAATAESVNTVLELAAEWVPGRADRKLIVAGCMPSRYGEELSSAIPEVDAFLPVAEERALLDLLERLTGVPAECDFNAREGAKRVSSGPSAYLQISDGCHRACAYCTIPAIRGPYRSQTLADIVAEATSLVASGAREIVLIGQDITAWGRDLEGDEVLADVVSAVAGVPGVEWLRLMYAQPDGVTTQLLETMAAHANVCRYLDMPLQHSSRPVLRAMRRSGDGAAYLRLIQEIRRILPDVVLRTTLIAGFPGEGRADTASLARFLQAARFDYVGVFPYSQEAGTAAAEMPDQVAQRTKLARAQRLRDIADEIGFERASALVGKTIDVLVEGIDEDEGMVVGRWRGQAPEVDGIVLLDCGEPGQIVRATVVDSMGYDLEAEVIR